MVAQWAQFFRKAGIPHNVAAVYARSFVSNRITSEMLPDLDKSTLTDLGVTTIGDQLAILRQAKEKGSFASEGPRNQQRMQITAPNDGFVGASEARRGRLPPDRNEIYHVKMPDGTTRRTRQILAKHDALRRQGLAVRGTTGVRQAGRSVSPIDKNSVAARRLRREEVSSSTDSVINRLGVRGLHSDVSIQKTVGGRVIKRTVANPRARVIYTNAAPRVQVSLSGAASRVQRNNVAGRLGNAAGRVTVNVGRNQRQPASRINSRIQFNGGRKPQSGYEEEYDVLDDEYLEDDVVYEDDVMDDQYEDDGDLVEYVEAPSRSSVYSRLSK